MKERICKGYVGFAIYRGPFQNADSDHDNHDYYYYYYYYYYDCGDQDTIWLFNIAMEKSPFSIGKPSINGQFSMAMLNN